MKIISRWVPGELVTALRVVNERGWTNDFVQFVPAARGWVPQTAGHWIVLRLSEARAKAIESEELRITKTIQPIGLDR